MHNLTGKGDIKVGDVFPMGEESISIYNCTIAVLKRFFDPVVISLW